MECRMGASTSRGVITVVIGGVGTLALGAVLHDLAGPGIAVAGAAAFALLVRWRQRRDGRRRPTAIRLLGGPYAILYGPATRERVRPMRRVRVERVLHWPGLLIGLEMVPDPVGPVQAAARRLPGAAARAMAASAPDDAAFPAPRYLLIFADAVPSARFRLLAVHLRCMQRGVTLVEHR